jgi:hypothetical protein
LRRLGFIDIKPGKFGSISHVLIWNPRKVIRRHHVQKTPGLIEGNFNALLSRALEIGAKDMLEEPVVATTDEADEISF